MFLVKQWRDEGVGLGLGKRGLSGGGGVYLLTSK